MILTCSLAFPAAHLRWCAAVTRLALCHGRCTCTDAQTMQKIGVCSEHSVFLCRLDWACSLDTRWWLSRYSAEEHAVVPTDFAGRVGCLLCSYSNLSCGVTLDVSVVLQTYWQACQGRIRYCLWCICAHVHMHHEHSIQISAVFTMQTAWRYQFFWQLLRCISDTVVAHSFDTASVCCVGIEADCVAQNILRSHHSHTIVTLFSLVLWERRGSASAVWATVKFSSWLLASHIALDSSGWGCSCTLYNTTLWCSCAHARLPIES